MMLEAANARKTAALNEKNSTAFGIIDLDVVREITIGTALAATELIFFLQIEYADRGTSIKILIST